MALTPERAATLERLAAEFSSHLPRLVEVIGARVIATVPDIDQTGDPPSRDAITHSTHANVGAMLSMLAHGVPASAVEPMPGALELFDRLADRSDGLEIILRGYRSGMSELWQLWARFVADKVEDSEELYALLAASTSFIMTFIARMSDGLAIRWEQTRRRRERGLNRSPQEIIQTALFDESAPPATLDPLGYAADRVHLAYELAPETPEVRVTELLARVHSHVAANTLSLRQDAGFTVWLALDHPPTEQLRVTLERLFRGDSAVGASEPRPGFAGFRTVYHEAADARRIALLRGESGVTLYRDVALLTVLTADPERARALALAELGELAAPTPEMGRLRETLRVFLACGESQMGAAARLGVHEKTIAYRLRKAEELLGFAIRERHTEMEASLLIHAALDAGA